MLFIPIHSVDLSADRSAWKKMFEKTWPSYQRWFLKEGLKARPGYLTSSNALRKHMPELSDAYDELCELAGNGDLAARYLSMYCPPPYMSGCSQIAWNKDVPVLIRNYDYSPRYFEGVLMKTCWNKTVMGMSDCNWGLLDGVNEDGLCASLTFGGRRITGQGFGIPIVVRYCLETCSSTREAVDRLLRIPVHMAYNITLLDAQLEYATVFMVPGGPNRVKYEPIGTNHQDEITWSDYAIMTQTVERKHLLESEWRNPFNTAHHLIQKFLEKPLYNDAYEKAFGTLYTAVYSPLTKGVSLLWPSKEIHHTMEGFEEKRVKVKLKTNANRLLSL